MEEYEDPTESLQEKIHEKMEERGMEKLSLYVALSTAIMAVLAALSGLMAGHHSNEALIEQVKAADQWAYYQSRGIKSEVVKSTAKIIGTLSPKTQIEQETGQIDRYEQEKEVARKKAEESEKSSESHLNKHSILSKAVTLFQIAIAISAISVLTKKRMLWMGSLVVAATGLGFLLAGMFYQGG